MPTTTTMPDTTVQPLGQHIANESYWLYKSNLSSTAKGWSAGFLLHFLFGRELLGISAKSGTVLVLPFLYPASSVKALRETQSTDYQPMAWLRPFFVHDRTVNGRGIAVFSVL